MFKTKINIIQMLRLIILFLNNDYFIIITSVLVSFLFFTFVADGFKLSNNNIIRFLQKYTLILSILIAFLLFFILLTTLYNVYFNSLILLDPALSVNTDYNLSVLFSESNNSPNNNMSINTSGNITVSGNVTLSKESAAELGKGAANAASNVGLGASIGGMSAAMVQALKHSSLPVGVKAGAVIGAGAAGATIHVTATSVNRAIARSVSNNNNSSHSTTETHDFPIDFVAPSVNEEFIHSSLQDLLLSLITLNTISLWMCLLVIISLVYKFILPSELTLRWLNNILPEHYVIKIKTVLNRVIDLNKKTNIIYIFIILFTILICNVFSVYFMNELYNNLDFFCIDHFNFKK